MYSLWTEGKYLKAYTHFGAHRFERDGEIWYVFRVYAPSAKKVYLKSDINDWYDNIEMQETYGGIWEVEVEGVKHQSAYKYCVLTHDDRWLEKTDPFCRYANQYPTFNSVVYESDYTWNDDGWLQQRKDKKRDREAMLIYEVHLGSWQKTLENTFLDYSEIAQRLVSYVKACGFTHIELLPIAEHPYLGSWGYQQTGLFAPTSRYGTPDQFRYFIDFAHQHNIGVILDFVPVHFCKDAHGLSAFDGTYLYEYSDDRRENKGWGTTHFDLGKGDVQSFLLSALDYWITEFHIDGIRFDAVSHLIYRNGMKHDGLNEEGVMFTKHMNGLLEHHFPDVLRIAEDSSDFQGVTLRTEEGGLGFHLKWDLGFANDHFQFMQTPYAQRSQKSDKITFARAYHESEHFLLPYSHDEVVHGKKSLLMKQQGTREEQFAALAVEYAFWIFHPGKKLIFMGQEFGQEKEWNEAYSLDWHLLDDDGHRTFFEGNKRLFYLYREHCALYAGDYTLLDGFDWLVIDSQKSVYAIARRFADDELIGIFNFDVAEHRDFPIQTKRPNTRYTDLFTGDERMSDENGVLNMNVHRLSYQILKRGGK